VPLILLQAVTDLTKKRSPQPGTASGDRVPLTKHASFPSESILKHALTHEVAYSGLLHERRRVLHARIVDALEDYMWIAWLNRSTGWRPRLAGRGVGKASLYCRQAGAKATERSALQEASRPLRGPW